MSYKRLKGVMIGAGFFAQFQAEAWRRIPGARITAVADAVADKAEQFASQWRIARTYAGVEEMLDREQPDFVDIVTRPLAQFTFAGGAQGLIDANRFTGHPFPSKTFGDFTLEGERAKIRVTPQGEIFLTDHGSDERAHEFVGSEQGYKGDSVHAVQQHCVSQRK